MGRNSEASSQKERVTSDILATDYLRVFEL